MVHPMDATMATTISGTHLGEVRGRVRAGAGERRRDGVEDVRLGAVRAVDLERDAERNGDVFEEDLDDVERAAPERVPVFEVPRLSPAVAPRCDVGFCAMLS
jgi:hypothetical protein